MKFSAVNSSENCTKVSRIASGGWPTIVSQVHPAKVEGTLLMKNIRPLAAVLFGMAFFVILALAGAKCSANPVPKTSVEVKPFGTIASGEKMDLYVLKNSRGMVVAVTNYGATVVSIKLPDRAGKFDDVVLGYDSAKG